MVRWEDWKDFVRRGQAAQKAVVDQVATKKVLFDSKCYALAEAFLADEPTLNTEPIKRELAAAIQWEVENWIRFERKKHEAKK